MVPVLEEEARKLRNRRRVVVRVDRAIDAVAEERAEVVREAVRIDTLALHEAGIPVRGLLRSAAPIDEDGRATALLQVDGDRDADDPGAED
jgi:hypothetical protein